MSKKIENKEYIKFRRVRFEHNKVFDFFLIFTLLMDLSAIVFAVLFFEHEKNSTLEAMFILFSVIAISFHSFAMIGWRIQVYKEFRKYFKGIEFDGKEFYIDSSKNKKMKWENRNKSIYIRFHLKWFFIFKIQTKTTLFNEEINFAIIDFAEKTLNVYFNTQKTTNVKNKELIIEKGLLTIDLKNDELTFFKNPKHSVSYGEFKKD